MVHQPEAFSRVSIDEEPGSSNGDLPNHRQARCFESHTREGHVDHFLMDKNGVYYAR
jgi:hypothetical protein